VYVCAFGASWHESDSIYIQLLSVVQIKHSRDMVWKFYMCMMAVTECGTTELDG
jgi:hypothetical protein